MPTTEKNFIPEFKMSENRRKERSDLWDLLLTEIFIILEYKN